MRRFLLVLMLIIMLFPFSRDAIGVMGNTIQPGVPPNASYSGVANITSGTIAGVTIDNSTIGSTTPSSGVFSSVESTLVTVGSTTETEIGYISTLTSAAQAQIDLKAPIASPTFTGPVTTDNEVTAKQYNSSAESNTHFINVANATAPTSPSLGDCYYDNVTFGWLCYNGSSWAASTATSVAWDNVTSKGNLGLVKDLVIRGYASSDNNTLIWKADVEQTLTQLDCITGGTDNVTITLHECDSAGANCLTTGLSVAATSSGASDASPTNAVIDQNDWVRVLVESIQGTATHVACTVRYTVAR